MQQNQQINYFTYRVGFFLSIQLMLFFSELEMNKIEYRSNLKSGLAHLITHEIYGYFMLELKR
jgi:hypothetical protein